jgi:hypothetical protein
MTTKPTQTLSQLMQRFSTEEACKTVLAGTPLAEWRGMPALRQRAKSMS